MLGIQSHTRDDGEVLPGIVQHVGPNKARIEYFSGGQFLVVSCDLTELSGCCQGDHVTFCLSDSRGDYCTAHHVKASPWQQIFGTVESLADGQVIVRKGRSGDQMVFSQSQQTVQLCEGMFVCCHFDDKNVLSSVTPVPQAGPHVGVVSNLSNHKTGKVTTIKCEIGGMVMEFYSHDNPGYTLLHGDIVLFYTTGGSHADHVILDTMVDEGKRHEETILEVVNDENGYHGVVGEGKVPFNFTEIITSGWTPKPGDKVTYTRSRDQATRVVYESDWSDVAVRSETTIGYQGNQNEPEPVVSMQPPCSNPGDHTADEVTCDDDLEFLKGLVATLRDGFGFIEDEDRSCEVFFSFSGCSSGLNPHTLALLDEVQYQLQCKDGKTSAINVQQLPKGSVQLEHVEDGSECTNGTVLRPMKSFTMATTMASTQDHYEGIIQASCDDSSCYPYTISSLTDPSVALQTGDPVQFKVGILKGRERAVQVISCKRFITGQVESLKSKERYGFISYKDDGGSSRSVFFHMSSVEHGEEVAIGDQVKFQLSFSQRAQKHSASHVSRCVPLSTRPGWLVARSYKEQASPLEFSVLRQPHGPDKNSRGFSQSD